MQFEELEKKNNLIIPTFIFSAILIELFGVYFIEGRFNISNLLPMMLILSVVVLISTVFDSFGKKFIFVSYLVLSSAITVVLSIIYTMQGGAVFKISMFAMINEGLEIAGSLIINYSLVVLLILIIFGFIAINFKKIDKKETSLQSKLSRLLAIFIVFMIFIPTFNLLTFEKRGYENILNNPTMKYETYGTSTLFYKTIIDEAKDKHNITKEDSESFLKEEIFEASGISENKNVISILVETFEWYSFIDDEIKYPGKPNKIKEGEPFPTIKWFYNNSIVYENNVSRNSTIISEDLMLLGNNYVNPKREIKTSLANMLKEKGYYNQYVHVNDKTYYSRDIRRANLGFDKNIDRCELESLYGKMDESSMSMRGFEGGINFIKDSEVIKKAGKDLFPSDKKFYTHFSTMTMHGSYGFKRNGLDKEYETIEEFYGENLNQELKDYLASTLDFEKALQFLLIQLNEQKILDKTVIILASDHNAYSNNLNEKVRGSIDKEENFKVPLIIYDQNLGHKIDKTYTNPANIVPTVLDLLGINYYKNFYLGDSLISDDIEDQMFYSDWYKTFHVKNYLLYNFYDIVDSKEVLIELEDILEKQKRLFRKKYSYEVFYQ